MSGLARVVFPLLLLVLLTLPSVALSRGVYVGDEVETGSYLDLRWFEVGDNGTHLILSAGWMQPLPNATPAPGSYSLSRVLYFSLDLDNSRKTGCCPGWPGGGNEIEGWASYNIYGDQWLGINLYSSGGSYLGLEGHPQWASSNDTVISAAIPLSYLNISRGDRIMIHDVRGSMEAQDYIGGVAANWTVPYAEISVDGDPGDWAGIDPLAVDSDDGFWVPYQMFNMTRVYVASDNKALYVRMDLGDVFNTSRLRGLGGYLEYLEFIFAVDVDNDGMFDYVLHLHPWGAGVESHGSEARYTYPSYNASWYNTSHVEFALSLSAIGVNNGLAGRNLTLGAWDYVVHVDDYLRISQYLFLPYWQYWLTRIFYTVGSGGYMAVPEDRVLANWTGGWRTIHIGGVEFNISASGQTWAWLARYDAEPTGNSSLNALPGGMSQYYAIKVFSLGSITWPIHVEAEAPGKTGLTLLYYNATAGSYKPLGEQSYDPATGTLKANLTQDEYQAGDDPILILTWKPGPVGGALNIQAQKNNAYPAITIAATLLTAIPTIIILAHKHKKTH